ncbi:MAG: FtsQ-type POTRA domain-containing protein [Gammaproteobacteria bacterium]
MTPRRKRRMVATPDARRESLRRLARRAGLIAFVAIVGVGGWMAWQYRAALPSWPTAGIAPVQRVLVEGAFIRVSPTDVENVVLPHLRGGFFTVDLGAIRTAAESLPWVARAQVLREWPDRVRIIVAEEQPAWLWGDDGLLNARAELFVTAETNRPVTLPRLDGPAGTERLLAQQYLEYDATLMRCAMRVARVELDARRATRLTLAGGIVLRLGRHEVPERAGRFCDAVLGAVAPRIDDVAYVDMRYTNGFAVGWRGG